MDKKNWIIETALDDEIVMYKPENSGIELIVLERANNGEWYLGHECFEFEDIDQGDFEEWIGYDMQEFEIDDEIYIKYLCSRGSSIIGYWNTKAVIFKNIGLRKILEYTGVDLFCEHDEIVHISDYRDWLVNEYAFDTHASTDLLDGLIEWCRRKGYEGDEMFKTIIRNVLDTEDYNNLREMVLMF